MLPKPTFKLSPNRPNLHAMSDDDVSVAWIGHSTVYVNFYGVKFITDPVFSQRIGVSVLRQFTVGMKRHTAPAIDIQDVPALDFIFLSHAHMDHVDLPSLRRLATPKTTLVTSAGTARLFRHMKFAKVVTLAVHEHKRFQSGLTVRALPVKHWGNRFPWNKTYGYNGYLIAYRGRHLVFAGDTAYTKQFAALAQLENIDIAIFPIGAYAPDSFQGAHCTPEQAWQMFVDTGANAFVPVHFDTFVLSAEPVDEPMQRLLEVAGRAAFRVVVRAHGDVFTLRD